MSKYCTHCGNTINEQAVICPNCGCRTENGNSAYDKAKNSKIFGILGLFLGIIFSIIAIVLGNNSKKENGGVYLPDAKVGVVCGWITVGITIAVVVIWLLMIIGIGASVGLFNM